MDNEMDCSEAAGSPYFQQIPEMDDAHDYEWDYTMRRQMQEIIPGVYLGPYAVATRKMLPYLQQNHVTHIVCVRHPSEARTIRANFPEVIQYLVVDLAGNHIESVIPYFSKVKEFVDICLTNQGRCLFHGNAGISASATFVIAYIMETFGINFTDGYQMVQRRRFCVSPSESFKRQLLEYEAIYLAKRQVMANNVQGSKRGHDENGESSGEYPYKKQTLR